jgi:hypothetical protein
VSAEQQALICAAPQENAHPNAPALTDSSSHTYAALAHSYGVDFLVDAAFRVMLLEFNPTPDLRMTGSRLDGLVGRLVDGVVAIATGEAPGAESGAFDCVYAKEWPKKGSIKVT